MTKIQLLILILGGWAVIGYVWFLGANTFTGTYFKIKNPLKKILYALPFGLLVIGIILAVSLFEDAIIPFLIYIRKKKINAEQKSLKYKNWLIK